MILQLLYRSLIELSNHAILSKAIQKFTKSKLSSFFIRSYVRVYKINQEEMEFDLQHYQTLEQLFVRKLKYGVRPINREKDSVVSPVDGIIVEFGTITPEKEIVVKGKRYSIQEMFGKMNGVEKYIDGIFLVIYLSPSHYHRIHSPVSGKIIKSWTLGLKSYPVNKFGMAYGKAPLSKNYRKMTEIMTDHNRCITIAKIGAMYINSIHTTNKSNVVTKGEEIAYFSFGSTVILLFEKNTFEINPIIFSSQHIKVGQKIGTLKKD